MKIYAQAHKIKREHLVVSVFRDCRKFIFVAYDPKTGLQYHTQIPEVRVCVWVCVSLCMCVPVLYQYCNICYTGSMLPVEICLV